MAEHYYWDLIAHLSAQPNSKCYESISMLNSNSNNVKCNFLNDMNACTWEMFSKALYFP